MPTIQVQLRRATKDDATLQRRASNRRRMPTPKAAQAAGEPPETDVAAEADAFAAVDTPATPKKRGRPMMQPAAAAAEAAEADPDADAADAPVPKKRGRPPKKRQPSAAADKPVAVVVQPVKLNKVREAAAAAAAADVAAASAAVEVVVQVENCDAAPLTPNPRSSDPPSSEDAAAAAECSVCCRSQC